MSTLKSIITLSKKTKNI